MTREKVTQHNNRKHTTTTVSDERGVVCKNTKSVCETCQFVIGFETVTVITSFYVKSRILLSKAKLAKNGQIRGAGGVGRQVEKNAENGWK